MKDHRTALRFDARGRLAGHLVGSNQPVFVVNIGLGGFAVEGAEPVAAGPHIVRFTTSDHRATLLEARSVYCRPTPRVDGARRFAAGFEFIRPPRHVDQTIKGILELVGQLRLGR
jgi:fructose 1,6-bisphosphatase